MAKYNPFFERVGRTKIQETTPPKQALAIRDVLARLGFDVTLLSSGKFVISKLESLTSQELSSVRTTFTRNAHPRFLKEFFYHLPYGKRELYKQEVRTAILEKLAKLIHVAAMLLQTKFYLFWKKDDYQATLP